MFFKPEKMNSRGFTLVEMIVSIFISALIAASVLPGYRDFQKRASLLQDAHHLSEGIREAQEMSVSGKKISSVFPDAYGVYLQENGEEYIIYADMNGDGLYSIIQDEMIRTVDLHNYIKIKDLPYGSSLNITFYPPDPRTEIRNGTQTPDELSIVLGIDNLSYEKNVYINKAGLTYVE